MSEKREVLEFFARYIESELGIVYSESNFFQLEHRLKEVVKECDLLDLNDLYQTSLLAIDEKVKSSLLNRATNNETSFFRDRTVFNCLAHNLLPELYEQNGSRALKFWSAASSSGQEAYSIAMVVQQYLEEHGGPLGYEMLVSDVSDIILKRAESGVYSTHELDRGLPQELKEKYFECFDDRSWRVSPLLKKNLSFRVLNLLEAFENTPTFDLVFCRNVLIYLTVDNKKKIIDKLADSIEPGGYLILGSAESLIGLSDRFKQINLSGAIVYQLID